MIKFLRRFGFLLNFKTKKELKLELENSKSTVSQLENSLSNTLKTLSETLIELECVNISNTNLHKEYQRKLEEWIAKEKSNIFNSLKIPTRFNPNIDVENKHYGFQTLSLPVTEEMILNQCSYTNDVNLIFKSIRDGKVYRYSMSSLVDGDNVIAIEQVLQLMFEEVKKEFLEYYDNTRPIKQISSLL